MCSPTKRLTNLTKHKVNKNYGKVNKLNKCSSMSIYI